jgi:hypothetical protein
LRVLSPVRPASARILAIIVVLELLVLAIGLWSS